MPAPPHYCVAIVTVLWCVPACQGGSGTRPALTDTGSTTGAPTDASVSASDNGESSDSPPTTGAHDSTGTTSTDDGSDTSGSDEDTGGNNEPPPCDYYSSPEGGGPDADGSAENPWGSLEQLAAEDALVPGILCLTDGFHGNPLLQPAVPVGPTTVRAQNHGAAVVGTLRMVGVEDLTLWGLTVDGTSQIDPGADQRQSFLVTGDANTHDITLDSVRVQSAASSADWDQAGWVYQVRSGADFRGTNISVIDSEIRNTYHALLLRGDGSLVEGTTIDNFGGDGIRGLGSHSRYSWNVVRDAYIDEYEVQHDDAFQAYRLDGEDLRIVDVTIDHNQFIVFADPITEFVEEHELVGTLMQGVIITDGYADGWNVHDNLVVGGQSHGISLFGARNCRVQNNTVVAHPLFVPEAGPWIRITDQTKTGQANFDNIIRNNVAQMLTPWDYDVTSTVEFNVEAPWDGAMFVDSNALDFRPLAGGPAVDAGTDVELSELDLDGQPRVVGGAVDLGAYEAQ